MKLFFANNFTTAKIPRIRSATDKKPYLLRSESNQRKDQEDKEEKLHGSVTRKSGVRNGLQVRDRIWCEQIEIVGGFSSRIQVSKSFPRQII